MIETLQNEVDANYKAFRDLLPELMLREANRWALMKNENASISTTFFEMPKRQVAPCTKTGFLQCSM